MPVNLHCDSTVFYRDTRFFARLYKGVGQMPDRARLSPVKRQVLPLQTDVQYM
ncbi:MAG: hypothetical protein LBV41_06815 [Cytophagaceae bacterium]|nr:hypothetical protein [Cytophagaceae bacterium]